MQKHNFIFMYSTKDKLKRVYFTNSSIQSIEMK